MATTTEPRIAVSSHAIDLPGSNARPYPSRFILSVTALPEASLLLWVGPAADMLGAGSASDGQAASLKPASTRLAADWACGVPSVSGPSDAHATTIARTGLQSSSVAHHIARRLALRLRRQVFLSLDLPPSLVGDAQASSSVFGADIGPPTSGSPIVALERQILLKLEEVLPPRAAVNGVP